ncbi:cation:proton antiporter regulatory subunit [Halodesulfurarchaeum formicicum]|uniref:TrkA-C domain-containing protein n=1 Tax=Halodesulfurarchaeum formicicum TaxID=1873524 RepID=A0A1J1A9M5_9EURY|nr:TrkA C-terminal domain-containing protein [Halodesulfurarchaeum formicicum]APE94818.1 TrkA-C domain-containing protein [Halodesulfurarchaeum formicicum]
MTVYETDLPGVGRKFEIDVDNGAQLVIVIHNTGKREVYRKPNPEADAEKVFEASNQLSQTIGSILEGAKFQPVEVDHEGTMLPGDTVLEWYTVTPDSELAGCSLGESAIREGSDVLVVAIQRGEEIITSPGPDTTVEPGDVLVVIGTQSQVLDFETLVADEVTEE